MFNFKKKDTSKVKIIDNNSYDDPGSSSNDAEKRRKQAEINKLEAEKQAEIKKLEAEKQAEIKKLEAKKQAEINRQKELKEEEKKKQKELKEEEKMKKRDGAKWCEKTYISILEEIKKDIKKQVEKGCFTCEAGFRNEYCKYKFTNYEEKYQNQLIGKIRENLEQEGYNNIIIDYRYYYSTPHTLYVSLDWN